MKTKINTHVVNAEQISSRSLGVLGSIAHPIKEQGDYVGTLIYKNSIIATVRINVSEDVNSTQVDIDFAKLHKANISKGSNREIAYNLNPKGYLMLFVSNGSAGYHFLLNKLGDARSNRVFDSRSLSKGDLFVLTLIRPGEYTLLERRTKKTSTLSIAYPKISKKAFTAGDPVHMSVNDSGFSSKKSSLDPGQGIILNVENSKTSFNVTLSKQNDGPKRTTRKSTQKHTWVNPRSTS